MKRFRNDVILATLAVSLATGAAAFAQDTKYDSGNEVGDQNRTRGITIRPSVPIPAPAAVKPQPVVETPCKTPPVKSPVAVNNTAKTKQIRVVKHSAPSITKTATAVPSHKLNAPEIVNAAPIQPNQGQFINVSHQAPIAAASMGSVVVANLDRTGSLPKYKVGEKLVVNIKATQDCNLVVFNYDSTGTLTQIFPNDYQQSGFVRSGDQVQIGGPESPFDYQVAGKGGQEKIFVYAYPTGSEAPLTVAMNPLPNTPFRSAEITPDQYRQMVNDSKVFFSREVKILPKRVQNVSATQPPATANKVELTFMVEK